MARAAFSATMVAFRAGEGTEGATNTCCTGQRLRLRIGNDSHHLCLGLREVPLNAGGGIGFYGYITRLCRAANVLAKIEPGNGQWPLRYPSRHLFTVTVIGTSCS